MSRSAKAITRQFATTPERSCFERARSHHPNVKICWSVESYANVAQILVRPNGECDDFSLREGGRLNPIYITVYARRRYRRFRVLLLMSIELLLIFAGAYAEEKNVIITLEPLNSKVNHNDYM